MFALGWAGGFRRPFGKERACALYRHDKELSAHITAECVTSKREKHTYIHTDIPLADYSAWFLPFFDVLSLSRNS